MVSNVTENQEVSLTRQYSKVLACTAVDRCWIIQYCRLLDGTYIDLHSKQVFLGTALIHWVYKLIRLLLLFYLDYWFSVISVLFCVFWSPHSLRSWWSRRQGQGITTMVNVQTLLGAFFNMSPRSAFVIDEALKLLILGLLSSQVLDYWISELLDIGLKGFCCLSHMICLTY
jgi:hypothetical protein